MAFSAHAAFEIKVTNAARNGTQNVAGMYGSIVSSAFTGADCDAGKLVVPYAALPIEGYESIVDASSKPVFVNGNAYQFINASTGKASGMTGDHTGIYALNTYDVQKLAAGDNAYNVGAKTLGLGLLSGYRGDFTELIVGEQYAWGVDNFVSSSAPSVGQYVTVSNGLWGNASTAAPSSGATIYGQVTRTAAFTEGASNAGTAYVLKIYRANA